MNRHEDGAAFPIVGEDRVSEWVDEMGAAYTAGARVLWVITAERHSSLRTSCGTSNDLRLGYVHRAAELLRDRPERAAVVSRIHRYFDGACLEGEDSLDLEALRADVLADVLASRARAHGVRVRVERPPRSGEDARRATADVRTLCLVSALSSGPTGEEE